MSQELAAENVQRLQHDQFDLRAYGEVAADRGAASSTQSAIWRVELYDSGEVNVIIGPGSVGVPLGDDTVAYTVSEAYEDVAKGFGPAEDYWYCDNYVPAKVIEDGFLVSYVGFFCYQFRPGEARIGYNYESSRWWGWGRYGDTRYTSWTKAQAQGTDTYEFCNRADGGTHRYRVRSWMEVRGTPWYQFPAEVGPDSDEFKCGSGV